MSGQIEIERTGPGESEILAQQTVTRLRKRHQIIIMEQSVCKFSNRNIRRRIHTLRRYLSGLGIILRQKVITVIRKWILGMRVLTGT